MAASLAVTLANVSMKSFEHQITSTKEIINKFPEYDLEASPECNRKSEKKKSNVKNKRIGSVKNAQTLIISFTLK